MYGRLYVFVSNTIVMHYIYISV